MDGDDWTSVKWSADAPRLVTFRTISWQKQKSETVVWNPADFRRVTLPGDFVDMTTGPAGTRIATSERVTRDGSKPDELAINIHDLATAKVVTITSPSLAVGIGTGLFGPDGKQIALFNRWRELRAGAINSVALYDTATGEITVTIPDSYGPVVFSPDGAQIATTGAPKNDDEKSRPVSSGGHAVTDAVTLWDTRTAVQKYAVGLEAKPTSIQFSSKGRWMAVSAGRIVEIVQLYGERAVNRFAFSSQFRFQSQFNPTAFSPDETRFCTPREENSEAAKVWDLTTGNGLFEMPGQLSLRAVHFSRDGKRLFVDSDSGLLTGWDVLGGREIPGFRERIGRHTEAAFAPRGDRLAVVDGNTIRIWDASPDAESVITTPRGWGSIGAATTSVAFDTDGKRLTVSQSLGSSWDRSSVEVWDIAARKQVSHDLSIHSIALPPRGSLVAEANNNKPAVKLVNSAWNGILVREFKTPNEHVRNLAFSPDGKRLAGVGAGFLDVWTAATGETVFERKWHVDEFKRAVFSPDNKWLAIVLREPLTDKEVAAIWDLATGVKTFELRDGLGINAIAFSHDDRRFATSSSRSTEPSTVRIWDATDHSLINSFVTHDDIVEALAFSPDGDRIATASRDCTVKLWDSKTGLEMLALHGFSDFVQCVAYSPDGHYLAAASKDGSAKVWDATPLDERSVAPRAEPAR